jgi:outer membrane protein assembly factor BamB
LLTACSTAGTTSEAPPAATSSPVSVSTSSSATPTASPEPTSLDVPNPSNLVAGFGSLWARSGSALWQISPQGQVVSRIDNVFSDKLSAVGQQNLAVGSGSVWTVQPATVLRIDPATGRVIARIDVASGCDDIAPGRGVIYLACRDSRLFAIDPESNKATLLTTTGVSPIGIAYGNGAVWWINFSEAGGVTKIDPSTGSRASLSAPYAKFVVPTAQRIWFIDTNGNAFSMDPGGSRPSKASSLARSALGVTFDHGAVLINDGDLVAFDANTGDVTQRADVSGKQSYQAVAGIAVLGPIVWLVDPKDQRIVAVSDQT